MNHKKWKNVLKNKVFLTTVLSCLILVTVAAAAMVYVNGRKNTNENPVADLNQTEEETSEEENKEAGVQEAEGETAATEDTSDDYGVGEGVLAENETEPAISAPEEPTAEETSPEEAAGEADSSNVTAVNLTFAEGSTMQWPIQGNVLMDFSMDHTVYYATLDQYKVSPAVLLQGEPGTPVLAPANAQVASVGEDEEIGTFVTLDLGNGYQAKLGNLTDVAVAEGQYVEAGTAIANLAEPTKYYTVEGPNLYFEVTSGETPVDPFLYLQ